jgi:hypothetical protein
METSPLSTDATLSRRPQIAYPAYLQNGATLLLAGKIRCQFPRPDILSPAILAVCDPAHDILSAAQCHFVRFVK